MVIKDIVEAWKQYKKQYVKKSTYSAYCLLLNNHLIPRFGDKSEFREEEVQDFVLDSLKNGLSQKTVKDILVVLKMIQKFGAKQKLMEIVPIDVVFPVVSDKKLIEVMTKENQRKLLTYVNENFSFKNLGIAICLCTGVRIGELCALRWCDFDMDQKVVKIRHTVQRLYIIDGDRKYTKIVIDKPKTKESNRDIPLSNKLQRIIRPLLKVVSPDFFILSNDEKLIEPRTYRNYYKKVMKKLDIPYLKFHGLRHSFATRCIESKANVKTISAILGHSNITTTLNLYVHPDTNEKRKCIERMMKLF